MVTHFVGCKRTFTQTHFTLRKHNISIHTCSQTHFTFRKHFHTHMFTTLHTQKTFPYTRSQTLHTQKTFPYTHIHKHFTLRKMITAHLLQSFQYNPKDHLPKLEMEAFWYDEVRIDVQVKSQRLLRIKARPAGSLSGAGFVCCLQLLRIKGRKVALQAMEGNRNMHQWGMSLPPQRSHLTPSPEPKV